MFEARLHATNRRKFGRTIDGTKIAHPQGYFTGPSGSRVPTLQCTAAPWKYLGLDETTIPELLLSPSAEQGYYLFLYPLSPGKHTIRWVASGCFPGLFQDITYNLTVAK